MLLAAALLVRSLL